MRTLLAGWLACLPAPRLLPATWGAAPGPLFLVRNIAGLLLAFKLYHVDQPLRRVCTKQLKQAIHQFADTCVWGAIATVW